MIQFGWPWIFLLTPIPWLLRGFSKHGDTAAVHVPPALASALRTFGHPGHGPFRPMQWLLWLAWLSLLTAIAQPWQAGETAVQPVSGRALALAVDVSGSMERQDFSLNGETRDRLSVVKQIAHDFVSKRHGDRLSLVLYGRDAFIASPLTFDLAALGSILNGAGIGMAGRSTAIGDAIGLAIQTLQDDPATHKAIILLSDGTNNAGSVEPESAAALALSLGIRIHSIAMGSEDTELSGFQTAQSADLDEATLKAIAQTAGGQFFRARSSEDLAGVYAAIDSLERAEVDAPPVILRDDMRIWPQILLLCSLLSIAWLQRQRLRA